MNGLSHLTNIFVLQNMFPKLFKYKQEVHGGAI